MSAPLKASLVLLWLLSLLGPLAGCGEPSDARESDVVELNVLLAPDTTRVWRDLFDEFTRRNPGVRVNLIEGPSATNAREDQYVTAFLSGESPYDLVYADVPWIPKFAAGGWLEDLTDYWPKEQWDRFVPGTIAGSMYQGRIYRVPIDVGAGMVYYRTDLLAQAGEQPPETFAEFVRVAQALQAPDQGLWGYVWQGQQYEGLVCDYLEVLKGYGGTWIDETTNEVGLDQPPAIEAVTFLRNCIQPWAISPPGVTTYAEEESRQLFHAGRAVFHRNWPYVWRLSQAEGSPIRGKVGIMRVPRAPAGQHASTLGGWGFSITKSSRHKAEAWKAVQFLTDLPQAMKVHEATGTILALKQFYEQSDDPAIQQIYGVLQTTVPRPMTPQYAQASDILQRHLSSALTGSVTPEEAMRRAAKETRLLLGRRSSAERASR